jgi:hypothetical protein
MHPKGVPHSYENLLVAYSFSRRHGPRDFADQFFPRLQGPVDLDLPHHLLVALKILHHEVVELLGRGFAKPSPSALCLLVVVDSVAVEF